MPKQPIICCANVESKSISILKKAEVSCAFLRREGHSVKDRYLGQDLNVATEYWWYQLPNSFHSNYGSILLGFQDMTMDGWQTD